MIIWLRVRGMRATALSTRVAGGEAATALPVANSTVICIVKARRLQKEPVHAVTRLLALGSIVKTGTPVKIKARAATSSVRARQMTKDSGIQRWNQAM